MLNLASRGIKMRECAIVGSQLLKITSKASYITSLRTAHLLSNRGVMVAMQYVRNRSRISAVLRRVDNRRQMKTAYATSTSVTGIGLLLHE